MTPLRQRMIDEMTRRGFSKRTRTSYLWGVKGLAEHYHRSPDRISEDEIADYLLHLSRDRQLSPSSVKLAWNGMAFFYRHVLRRLSRDFHPVLPRLRQRVPDILSRAEAAAVIDQARNLKERLLLSTCYGAGLRVGELVRLKPTDLDPQRLTVRVDQGKGRKDRYSLLSKRLIPLLDEYQQKVGPRQWLFPGRRGHLGVSGAQRAYTRAKLAAALTKRGGIHGLRHAFATHLPVRCLRTGSTFRASTRLQDQARSAGHMSIWSRDATPSWGLVLAPHGRVLQGFWRR